MAKIRITPFPCCRFRFIDSQGRHQVGTANTHVWSPSILRVGADWVRGAALMAHKKAAQINKTQNLYVQLPECPLPQIH